MARRPLPETADALRRWGRRLVPAYSAALSEEWRRRALEEARARSPRASGRYAGGHEARPTARGAELGNTATRRGYNYAAKVEARHGVYRGTHRSLEAQSREITGAAASRASRELDS